VQRINGGSWLIDSDPVGSKALQYEATGFFNNDAPTTQQLTGGSFSTGRIKKAETLSRHLIGASSDCEYEFMLGFIYANVGGAWDVGDTIDIGVFDNFNGVLLGDYLLTASVVPLAADITQDLYVGGAQVQQVFRGAQECKLVNRGTDEVFKIL
jgi:hypothetical protein